MKAFLIHIAVFVLVVGLAMLEYPVLAQAPALPPPPGGGSSVAAPIDGFTWLLLLGGLGLGYTAVSGRSEEN